MSHTDNKWIRLRCKPLWFFNQKANCYHNRYVLQRADLCVSFFIYGALIRIICIKITFLDWLIAYSGNVSKKKK